MLMIPQSSLWEVWRRGETSILLEKLWEDDDKAVELADKNIFME